MPKGDIRETFLKAIVDAFPRAAETQVEHLLVVKSHAAFRCTPAVSSLTPNAVSPIENLLLKGDWTETGWPSTMEGSFRSGVAATQVISSRSQVE